MLNYKTITTFILLLLLILIDKTVLFRLNRKGPIFGNYTIECLEQIAINNFYYLNKYDMKTNYSLLLLTITIDSGDDLSMIEDGVLRRFHQLSKWSIESVTKRSQIEFKSTQIDDDKRQFVLDVNTNFYLISIRKPEDVDRKLTILINLSNYNQRGLFVIYSINSLSTGEVQQIVDKLLERMIFKILLLIPKNLHNFHLYSLDYRRVNGENCLDFTRILRLNRCRNGRFLNKSLDYHQSMLTTDFNNCTMNVYADQIEPFVITADEGIEIELLKLQSELLNLTFNITTGENYFWGPKTNNNDYGNYSINYVYQDFYLGIGNMAPSILYINDFEFTRQYFQENLVWIVPIADYVEKWRVLTIIFTTEVWAICGSLVVITAIFFHKFATKIDNNYYNNFNNNFFQSLQLLIGLSTPTKPKHDRTRLIYSFLAIFSVVIVAIYQMALIDYLTNPRRNKQISTVDDILDNNLTIKALRQYEELFNINPDILKQFQGISDAEQQLIMTANYRNSCTVFSQLYMNYLLSENDYHFVDQYNRSKLFILKELVTSYSLTILIKRGFPYLKQFNYFIHRLDDGALILGAASKYLYLVSRVKNKEDDDQSFQRLTVYHMQGAFVILAFGYLIAVISLIFEYIHYFVTIRKKSSQINRTKQIKK